ncbi:Protein pih1d3 [Chytriomyces hyalinus]|nr:Protein pih1d3 [Chytriomyces hyalinus]
MNEISDFSSLTALFQTGLAKQNGDLPDARGSHTTVQKLTPGSIGPSTAAAAKTLSSNSSTKPASKDIWDDGEVDEAAVDVHDPRPQPEYKLTYRQKVTSEDMYLQMSGKTPGIHDSDEVVVTIDLPGVQFSDIVLTCTETSLDMRCPKYKLLLHFPRTVRDQDGNATWNKSRNQLVVAMPIKPDFL